MSSRRFGPAPATTGGRWSSCLDSARRPRGMCCDQLHATVLDAWILAAAEAELGHPDRISCRVCGV
jgi:hypothetical protein